MVDVKHCIAINDFEGFLHIFYCRIKNFMESLTEKLLRQVGWQGRVRNNQNLPHDVRSPDCRILTQTYLPNFFSSRFWRAVVSFTVITIALPFSFTIKCRLFARKERLAKRNKATLISLWRAISADRGQEFHPLHPFWSALKLFYC